MKLFGNVEIYKIVEQVLNENKFNYSISIWWHPRQHIQEVSVSKSFSYKNCESDIFQTFERKAILHSKWNMWNSENKNPSES